MIVLVVNGICPRLFSFGVQDFKNPTMRKKRLPRCSFQHFRYVGSDALSSGTPVQTHMSMRACTCICMCAFMGTVFSGRGNRRILHSGSKARGLFDPSAYLPCTMYHIQYTIYHVSYNIYYMLHV